MSKAIVPDVALSAQSLERYLQTVHQIPVLGVAEEHALARRLQEHNDLEAARQLVVSHLRFVAYVARGYAGYGLPMGDLIQEGNIGLMKAVRRFDPDKGVRLVSFAVHWIRAEIHEYILRNWRIVRVATTKAQRKLFFNLRGAKKRLGWFSREEVDAVAKDLGVSAEDVLEMEARLSAHDAPFDAPADADDEEASQAPARYLTDMRMNPEAQLEAAQWEHHGASRLQAAMATLDARSNDILRRRWLAEEKATLHELAEEYQVSAERIRQLEQAAIRKLKSALEA